MEGFLQVWHGYFSRWTTYYFRIHEKTLMFGPKKQQVEGTIHLQVAQIISIIDDPITFIIHTGTDTLRLRANSIDERVKWFKKLKEIKQKIEEENYGKSLSSMNYEKSKDNRIKMLESIVLDLWQSHAELSNQIDDIAQKFKSNSLVKTLTDKLRMTVQTIKLKNSEALKIIEEFTRSEREKRGAMSNRGMYSSNSMSNHDYNDQNQPNGTLFMSFDDKKNKIFKKVSKKTIHKQPQEFQDFQQTPFSINKHIDHDASNSQVSVYKHQSSKHISKSRGMNSLHKIKQRLIHENPVYVEVVRSISDTLSRSVLPERFTPEEKFPIGEILKNAIGSDLSKFALPVAVNEPLSVLQKGCEQMYYSQLLDKANEQDKPEKRMLYVVAFLISQYSLSDQRTKKPFNPLLGETFEYWDDSRQFEYISEQVSHHPPISAMYCRSDNFEVFDQSKGKTGFAGKSIQVTPEGKSKIKLERYIDEEYLYDKCPIILTNVILSFSKTELEIVGKMTIECAKNQLSCVVNFKEAGFMSKSGQNEIEGEIKMNGNKCYNLSGKWTESVKAMDLRDKSTQIVWSRKHAINKDYYNYNEYTMQLNHLNKRNLSEFAPTDSRLRPDQRALEYRRMDLAEEEKLRLENKQRAKRKENEEKNLIHVIKWFKLETDQNGVEIFMPNGNYKRERERGDWNNFPDIY